MKKRHSTEDHRSFVFGGRRVVAAAVKAPHISIQRIYITKATKESAYFKTFGPELARRQVRLEQVDDGKLESLTSQSNHQGIACEVSRLPDVDLNEIIAAKQNLIALDQVQDPMNLGAILRSANAAGIGGLICPKDRSAKLTPTAIKVSAGAALHTPVVYVTNLSRQLVALKESGYWILALAADDKATNIVNASPPTPWVLVVGNEGKGIRPLVQKKADLTFYIPMAGAVESLNVSAASAVALYHLSGQLV